MIKKNYITEFENFDVDVENEINEFNSFVSTFDDEDIETEDDLTDYNEFADVEDETSLEFGEYEEDEEDPWNDEEYSEEDEDELWGESIDNYDSESIFEASAPKKLTGKAKIMKDDKSQLMNALNKDEEYMKLVDGFEKKATPIVKKYINDLSLKIKPKMVFTNLKIKGGE